jgi:hypothetical protein
MKPIIPPVDRSLLEQELHDHKFVRNTNNGKKQIYIFTAHDSPNLMQEVGRLREITFRDAGGGTGKEVDIDEFDVDEYPFQQLVVWDPAGKEIIGGYRFIHGKDIPCNEKGCINSATGELFQFTARFIRDFLPESIELGRSFVQPAYQPTFNLRRGMYSLDNLWDGLGAMVIDNPDVKYFYGKMTMYPSYHRIARDTILYFLEKFFPDPLHLMTPFVPVVRGTPDNELAQIFSAAGFEDNYRILVQVIRKYNESIPPLINAYMSLSPTMMTFGTAINKDFGNVEETAILINIEDIYPRKLDRHLKTYIQRISSLKNLRWRRRGTKEASYNK